MHLFEAIEPGRELVRRDDLDHVHRNILQRVYPVKGISDNLDSRMELFEAELRPRTRWDWRRTSSELETFGAACRI